MLWICSLNLCCSRGGKDWRESGLTIVGRFWWVWWGRMWRGQQGGRGSWAAARWPRRQPAGCSFSWRAAGASGRVGGWGWWPPPEQTTKWFCLFTFTWLQLPTEPQADMLKHKLKVSCGHGAPSCLSKRPRWMKISGIPELFNCSAPQLHQMSGKWMTEELRQEMKSNRQGKQIVGISIVAETDRLCSCNCPAMAAGEGFSTVTTYTSLLQAVHAG